MGVTTVGVNDMLNTYFAAATQTTTWYLGLVDNASFTSFAIADTMGSHAGWAESTAYTQATRPQWTPFGAPSAGSISNSSVVVFSINATGVIKGVFVTTVSTKSGTTGTLYAAGAFSSNQSVVNGSTLNVTATATLTPT